MAESISTRRRTELAGVTLFTGLGARALARIDRLATEVDIAAGRPLTVEGAAAREAFVILCGEVEVSASGYRLATLGRGDVLGEMAL
ncbi:MAG TPA: cyclic nucleotide-binding domain-containing protein, partial [Acidimicrobiales bacterium]|nr:cyclic nucleotide-binding domain-containing protein [Acidimicrobiales bacterium]